ncbi:MAG: hypothetical protein IJX93_05835 [Clostridia bacterium]|nr:hypothetical protein [Clostridia bacterium]
MKMNRKKTNIGRSALALVFCGAVLTGCRAGAYSAVEAEYPEMPPYPGDEASLGHEARHDAWNEARKALRNQPDGYRDGLDGYFTAVIREFMTDTDGENRVFSPLSLYSALAMTAETAAGESRDQILALLGYDDMDTLRRNAKSVWEANYIDDGASKSILANSLWLNDDVQYNTETLNTLASDYYASSFSGDMGSDGYNAALQTWLNEQTGGLLADCAAEEQMDAETVMALISSVSYSGRWMGEFSESKTESGVFHGAGGDETAQFMQKKEIDDYYYWADSFAAYYMDLENVGGMWFVLPDEGVTPDDVLAGEDFCRLILDRINTAESEWEDRVYIKINVGIPKFSVQSELALAEGLGNLGVTDVFSPKNADFSPLTAESDEPVWLDGATQAVTLEIDEEGITAAAYTKMRYYGAPPPPEDVVDFICDRPFLFAVMSNDGLPMFTGVVNSVE